MSRIGAASSALALLLAGCARAVPDPARQARANAPLAVRLAAADAAHGQRLFAVCDACHNISPGGLDRDAPNLYGAAGGLIGHVSARFGYSAALQAHGGRWTAAALDRWLLDPLQFAPGTRMMFPGLPDGADRADVIAYLNQRGGTLDLPPAR